MAASTVASHICVITCFAALVSAEDFLGARITSEQVKDQFHTELRALMGRADTESLARLERLQTDLRPMFSALPKNADGSLEQGTVRYALHRFFLQQHGWYVRGLEVTGGEKWSDSASTAMLEDRIPSYVLQLFEQHHGGRTGLRELATLVAILEDVVHSETIGLLSTAYQAQGLHGQESLDGDTEHQILETYLLFYIMPNPKYSELPPAALNLFLPKVPTFYTGWLDTIMWAQDLRDTMDYEEHERRNPFVERSTRPHDFNSIARLVEGMGEKYGKFQDVECREMKNRLLELSDGSGRVRLSKFYEGAFAKTSQHFSESPDYLRHLGALDETNPQQPSVIVTNYMYARGNCVACSSLYSICCIDACEGLLVSLENRIANPSADPQTVAEHVAALPSDTVSVPRNLSAPMRRRLDEIAGRHGGSIPLHGRLFAQWMHHAFPNECPYPYVAGSLATPVTPADWLRRAKEGGPRLKVSVEEMKSFMTTEPLDAAMDPLPLPWTDEEELVAAIPATRHTGRTAAWLRLVALALAISSAATGLVRMLRAASASTRSAQSGKAGECCLRPCMKGSGQAYDTQFV